MFTGFTETERLIHTIIIFGSLIFFLYNYYRQSKKEESSVTYLRGLVKEKQAIPGTDNYEFIIINNHFNYIYYTKDKNVYENLIVGKEIDYQAIGNEIVAIE